MTLDLINLITSGATFATVLISYFTLREMNRQRKATYKPDLIMVDSQHSLYFNKYDETGHFEFKYYNHDGNDIGFKKPYAEVVNLGFGVAKSVEYECSFDQNKAAKIIKSLDKNKKFNLSESDDLFCLFNLSGKDLGEFTNSYLPISSGRFNFIHTFEHESGKNLIDILEGYFNLLTVYLFLVPDEYDFTIAEIQHFPPLEISIKYEDLGGDKYTKRFKGTPYCKDYNFLQRITKPGASATYEIKYDQVKEEKPLKHFSQLFQ